MTSDGLDPMERNDAGPSTGGTANDAPDAPNREPPSDQPTDEETPELSVDQLTQAFANLMGEGDAPAAPIPEEPSDQPPPAASSDGSDLDGDVDPESVTPESIVEAILFVGHPNNEPLTARMIASYLRGISPAEVDQLIVQLNERYEHQQAAYRVTSADAGYRMTLRPDLARVSESFYGRVRAAKLSQAAVDLLAIVAYNQPIARPDVDQLRGQASGGILAQLVRRQLLRVEYTTEKPRRKIYTTTDRFLDLFGLESLEDLPSYDDF